MISPTRLLLLSGCLLGSSFGIGQVHGPNGSGPAFNLDKTSDGDPFQVGTGIYFREYHDLYVSDSIPIKLVRTQRNLDGRSRAFGIGGSTSYDMFIIGDTAKFTWVALVLADGSRARYTRTSPGTGYADGVFEDRDDPSEFLGSRISWSGHNTWIVKLRDGREYTVQGCNATSKPGQCAVTEIRNAQGERLVVQRDRDGNIQRIISPHGHYIEFKNDPAGRILYARDDSGKWAEYTYDAKGCLTESRNSRGDQQTFAYDSHFNMVYVHEKGPNGDDGGGPYNFTIHNRYDASDRLSSQVVSTGQTFSVSYQPTQGPVRQAEVRSNEGAVRYFFDEVGFLYREEFRQSSKLQWTVNYTLEPKTHEMRDVTLACRNSTIHVPVKLGRRIVAMGESHKYYLSQMCSHASNSATEPASGKPNSERGLGR